MTTQRIAFLMTGALLVVLGLWMPDAWYDPLTNPEVPQPESPRSGLVLLQLALLLEGLLIVGLGIRGWRYVRLPQEHRLTLPLPGAQDAGGGKTGWLLVGITTLGILLRLWHLDSDLWLDEIAPLRLYGSASILQVMTSYVASNNHLLNTVLVKLTTGLLGDNEAIVRLPAVVFGMATVPLIYWLSREALSRNASLAVALLLAVSYHHIFFSQNARGYTAYVFFSLLATGLLCKALRDDRGRTWLAYIGATLLNFASLLISGFVFGAHVLIGIAALVQVKRHGGTPYPLMKRLFGVFAVAALLGFHLYSTIIPQAYAYIQATYSQVTGGHSPFSMAFFQLLLDGLAAGLTPMLLWLGLLGLPVLLIGFIALLRRNWVLIVGLVLPALLQVGLLLARGFAASPRFFILLLPCALLILVSGLQASIAWLVKRLGRKPVLAPRIFSTVIILGCLVALIPLKRYYAIPKQDYRGSLAFVEEARAPDGLVLVIHLAEQGYRYYAERRGIRQDETYLYVRSPDRFDAVLETYADREIYLVTTLHPILKSALPDLWSRIEADWEILRTFPGTLGDGHIYVWRRRPPATPRGS